MAQAELIFKARASNIRLEVPLSGEGPIGADVYFVADLTVGDRSLTVRKNLGKLAAFDLNGKHVPAEEPGQ